MLPELPDPLHPALVHFPIALAALVPLVAVLALLAIRRRFLPARSWTVVVLLQTLLVGSAWVAHETGHDQEERVERVVAERFIEAYEEAADLFFRLAVVTGVASGAGLLAGGVGSVARLVSLAASLATLGSAVVTGERGGALVYEHGAAQVYVEQPRRTAGGEPGRAQPASPHHGAEGLPSHSHGEDEGHHGEDEGH